MNAVLALCGVVLIAGLILAAYLKREGERSWARHQEMVRRRAGGCVMNAATARALHQCSVDGCDRPRKTRGMCGAHAERVRAGKPLDAPIRHQGLDLEDRMNRATAVALHRSRCRDPLCPSCETAAESRADDREPDYSTDGAADQYERSLGYV